MIQNTVVGAIELAASLKKRIEGSESIKVLKDRSLIDVASVARVEPICLVDADCMNVEATPDIMQVMHSMFSGYYLQAVNMVNTIGAVTVAERLAPFNPHAGGAFEELREDSVRAFSMEEYRYKLPSYKAGVPAIAMESAKEGEKIDDAVLNTIRDASALSVGKLFNVTLQSGEQKITVPVAIRMMVSSVPSRVMAELFSNTDAFDLDLRERFHAWKAGRISFWKDLVLCNDLIDKRIKTSINDSTGVLNMIRQRQSGNTGHMAMTGKASVANATNLAVLSADTLAQIESAMGGTFKNEKIRRAVFESTGLMIVAVVNKQWERVTFWFRGMDASSTLSYKELKMPSKNDGSNVVDILKAFMAGSNPGSAI
jgi:hypothetical protein